MTLVIRIVSYFVKINLNKVNIVHIKSVDINRLIQMKTQ